MEEKWRVRWLTRGKWDTIYNSKEEAVEAVRKAFTNMDDPTWKTPNFCYINHYNVVCAMIEKVVADDVDAKIKDIDDHLLSLQQKRIAVIESIKTDVAEVAKDE